MKLERLEHHQGIHSVSNFIEQYIHNKNILILKYFCYSRRIRTHGPLFTTDGFPYILYVTITKQFVGF